MLDDLTIAIRSRTAHIVAHRFTLENERHRNMSRLSEKLKLASEVVGRQTAKIEARADAILAREPLLERQTDEAFTPHEALLDEAERGVDALGRQLAMLSNNPPLEPSTTSPSGPRVLPDGLAGVGDLNFPKAAPEPTAAQQMPAMPTTDRVALGPHPDQPEGPIMATIDTATAQEVEQGGIATFRAAE